MTEWQWNVLVALIRTVLRMKGVDIPNMYGDDKELDDEMILLEATIRS